MSMKLTLTTLTLTTLALTKTFIWTKVMGENSIKVGNTLSNTKGSCKSRWVLKEDSPLGLYLKNRNKIVLLSYYQR